MYEQLERDGSAVGYRIEDEITESELTSLLAELEEILLEEGSLRLLVVFDAFPSFDVHGLDEDIGFWLEHRDEMEKYAVVGGGTLVDAIVALEDRVTGTEMEHFSPDERDEAWAWLQA